MKITLSSSELEILRKSAEGKSVKEIAADMDVPPQVISKSQKNLVAKTGEEDILKALQTIARRGFILTEEQLR